MPTLASPAMSTSRKLLVLALAVAALTVAAGTALAVSHDAADRSGNSTVSVAGSGEVEVAPDQAVLRLSVTATGSDAATVNDQLASGASELRATLSDLGIAEENVQTMHYNVREDRQRPEGNGESQYVGEHAFEVRLDDVDRVGEVLDAAVQGGADDVDGVRYTISEATRDDLRDEAIRAAVSDARDEASVIADASALELGGVLSASTGGTDVRPYRTEFAQTAGDAGGTTIDPRDVTVSASVEVTFAASDA